MNTFIKTIFAGLFLAVSSQSARLRQIAGMGNIAAAVPVMASGALSAGANVGAGLVNGAVSIVPSTTTQVTGQLSGAANTAAGLTATLAPITAMANGALNIA